MADTPLTEAEWRQIILVEVDPDAAYGAAALIDLYWRGNLRWAAVSVELRALLTEQQLLRVVLRKVAEKRDWSANGVSSKDSQLFEHLQALAPDLEARIAALRAGLSASGGPVTGLLTKTAPTMADPGCTDPNDPAWRGSPLRKTGWR